MVAIGLLSLCMSSAARGNRVSFGISVAVIGAVFPLTAYAIVHWASFAIARLMNFVSQRPVENTNQQPAMAAVVASDSGIPSISEETVIKEPEPVKEVDQESPSSEDGGEHV